MLLAVFTAVRQRADLRAAVASDGASVTPDAFVCLCICVFVACWLVRKPFFFVATELFFLFEIIIIISALSPLQTSPRCGWETEPRVKVTTSVFLLDLC